MSKLKSTADAIDRPTPEERLEVIEACTRMAHHTDRREWERLVEIFTEEVRLDYTSLQGGEPALVARDQLVDGWREALGGLAATQHLMTNTWSRSTATGPSARRTSRPPTCFPTLTATPPGRSVGTTGSSCDASRARGGSPA